jgi:hypothetical protein
LDYIFSFLRITSSHDNHQILITVGPSFHEVLEQFSAIRSFRFKLLILRLWKSPWQAASFSEILKLSSWGEAKVELRLRWSYHLNALSIYTMQLYSALTIMCIGRAWEDITVS